MSAVGGTVMRPTAQLKRVIANQKETVEIARAKGRRPYQNTFLTVAVTILVITVLFLLAYEVHENEWLDFHDHLRSEHHSMEHESHSSSHDKESFITSTENHMKTEDGHEQLGSLVQSIVKGKSIFAGLFGASSSTGSKRYAKNEVALLQQKSPLPAKAVATDPTEPLKKRGYYGGGSDPNHVGGFLFNDSASYEPLIWNFMTSVLNVSSVVDIGCGQGVSTQWFLHHRQEQQHQEKQKQQQKEGKSTSKSNDKKGLKEVKEKEQQGVGEDDVICVEGSSDAVSRSLVKDITVEHDYTRGPWWPTRIYDAAWVVEFVEHVHEQEIPHYMATLQRARTVFVTHACKRCGGWHHVTMKDGDWWKKTFQEYGFVYHKELTELTRNLAWLQTPDKSSNDFYFCRRGGGGAGGGVGDVDPRTGNGRADQPLNCSACEAYNPKIAKLYSNSRDSASIHKDKEEGGVSGGGVPVVRTDARSLLDFGKMSHHRRSRSKKLRHSDHSAQEGSGQQENQQQQQQQQQQQGEDGDQEEREDEEEEGEEQHDKNYHHRSSSSLPGASAAAMARRASGGGVCRRGASYYRLTGQVYVNTLLEPLPMVNFFNSTYMGYAMLEKNMDLLRKSDHPH